MDKITLYSFVSCLFFLLQRFFHFLKNRSFIFRVCFYDGVFLFKLSKIWIYQNVNILFSCRHYLNCSFQKISNLKTLATKHTPVREVECSRKVRAVHICKCPLTDLLPQGSYCPVFICLCGGAYHRADVHSHQMSWEMLLSFSRPRIPQPG